MNSDLCWLLNSAVQTKAEQMLKFNVNGSKELYRMENGMEVLGNQKALVTNSMSSALTKGTGTGLSEAALIVPRDIAVVRWAYPMLQTDVSGKYFDKGQIAMRIVDINECKMLRPTSIGLYSKIITA